MAGGGYQWRIRHLALALAALLAYNGPLGVAGSAAMAQLAMAGVAVAEMC